MRKPQEHSEIFHTVVKDRDAKHQLVWTMGWTFTFLLMSIYFLQGA